MQVGGPPNACGHGVLVLQVQRVGPATRVAGATGCGSNPSWAPDQYHTGPGAPDCAPRPLARHHPALHGRVCPVRFRPLTVATDGQRRSLLGAPGAPGKCTEQPTCSKILHQCPRVLLTTLRWQSETPPSPVHSWHCRAQEERRAPTTGPKIYWSTDLSLAGCAGAEPDDQAGHLCRVLPSQAQPTERAIPAVAPKRTAPLRVAQGQPWRRSWSYQELQETTGPAGPGVTPHPNCLYVIGLFTVLPQLGEREKGADGH